MSTEALLKKLRIAEAALVRIKKDAEYCYGKPYDFTQKLGMIAAGALAAIGDGSATVAPVPAEPVQQNTPTTQQPIVSAWETPCFGFPCGCEGCKSYASSMREFSKAERDAMMFGSFPPRVKSNVQCVACDENHMQPGSEADWMGRLEFKCTRCGSKRKLANWPEPTTEIEDQTPADPSLIA